MSVLDVNEYFLQGDTDAAVIQAALEAAAPGDTVRVPRFDRRSGRNEWRIGRPLVLKSGVRLLLDNCRLVLETGVYCNMITAREGAENIAVTGEGRALLSGGKWNYLSEKMSGRFRMPDVAENALLRFSGVSGLTVSGLQFEMARWASIMLDHTKEAKLRNLWFDMIPHVMNLYGIYVGCGCSGIGMENITGRTGEDTVLIFADSARFPVEKGSGIRDVKIRNLCTDPNRSSMVHIRANGGHRIRDIFLDGIMDSSDFFEKKRIRANLELGTVQAELVPAKPEDVSRIHMKNVFSAAYFTVALDSSLKDCIFENIWTFGDSINISKNNRAGVRAENVRFRRLYYGAGSEPNNSNSFISRYAKGAVPLLFSGVSGDVKAEKLFLQDEEEEPDGR